jgi:hypothetical protein
MLSKEDRETNFENWLETLPKSVAGETRSLFPGIADWYRIKGEPGHFFMYKLSLYSDEIVRCVVVHGKDSYAPYQSSSQRPQRVVAELSNLWMDSTSDLASVKLWAPIFTK